MSGATEGPDGSRKGWKHGRAVDLKTREVRFLSVSSMEKADPESQNGCPRRWWWQYVHGVKEEDESPALARGNAIHAEIARYMRSGVRDLSEQVARCLHMMEPPGPDLAVELDIVPDLPGGKSGLSIAPLRASGIPVVGAIDLMHSRRTNRGGTDVTDTHDPEGTVEVVDWKSCKDTSRAKSPAELLASIQMSGYGKYVFETRPQTRWVRLSHVYLPARGQGKKSTIRVDRDAINESWKHAEAVAVVIRDAARETSQDNVRANTGACRSYGRPCPAIDRCSAAGFNSLSDHVGLSAAYELHDQGSIMSDNPAVVPAAKLLSALRNGKTKKPDAPPKSEIPGPTPEEVAAERARLEQEERDAALLATYNEIAALRIGMVALGGDAAQAVARARGIKISAHSGLAGSGELGEYDIDDPAMLPQVLVEARALKARLAAELELTPTPEPPAILPPDAPESAPPPPAATEPAPDTSTADGAIAAMAAEPPKRKPGRPRKAPEPTAASTVAPLPPIVAATVTATAVEPDRLTFPEQEDERETGSGHCTDKKIHLYVDCVPSVQAESLWPIVWGLTERLSKQVGQRDFRLADPNGPLGFGRWKGALTAYIRETEIPPGHYTLDGSFGEIASVVVEAMREVVIRSGGIFVRGAR